MTPMQGRAFIDTNIVIYSLGANSTKAQIVAPLFLGAPTISTQVLSETANVAFKRLSLSLAETRVLITTLEAMCHVEVISMVTIHTAFDIRERYGFSWYDSLIIASALEADCDVLYSEDMQNEQEINGHLRIVNPFA
jgi:predicted nucleic acid-binding protein